MKPLYGTQGSDAVPMVDLYGGKQFKENPLERLTPHFTEDELNPLKLPLTKLIKANLRLLAWNLEAIRSYLGGRKMRITSGYRNIKTELAKKRSGRSRHVLGEAVDFVVEGMTPEMVQDKLKTWWRGGLGLSPDYTHVDIRDKSTIRPTAERYSTWKY